MAVGGRSSVVRALVAQASNLGSIPGELIPCISIVALHVYTPAWDVRMRLKVSVLVVVPWIPN